MRRPGILLLYGLDHKTLPVDSEATLYNIGRMETELRARKWRVATSKVVADFDEALSSFSPGQWIVFNLCEGSPSQPFYFAEAARELETRGYAYTGSDATALDETQYKDRLKRILTRSRIPTPKWASADSADDLDFDCFPAIVKPLSEHCSFGICRDSVVFDLAQARLRAESLLSEYPGGVLVEEFLDSEEYTVAVWGHGKALEALEISMVRYDAFESIQDRLCTFEAKWLEDSEVYQKTLPQCPAPVSERLRSQLEKLAIRSHEACGLRDYSRVDVRLRDGVPMVLDVNANCDLSETGGFANTAVPAGWDYGCLLEQLALMAIGRSVFSARRVRPVRLEGVGT
jgi:D-alanine-D-alanine ligase